MRARDHLEQAIAAAHPTLQLRKPAERLGEPDPSYTGTVQIIRTAIEPAPEQRFWLESLDVWIVTRLIDPAPTDAADTDLETDLDDLADDVLDTLRAAGGVRFIKATREMHPDGPHAYRIQVTAKTY